MPIRIAAPGVSRDRLDGVDRARAFDQTYRASVTGNPKRQFQFSTPPVLRSVADQYETGLSVVTAQTCSGDVIGGSQNLVLQSENFGVTWGVDGSPTRSPADIVVGGITLDALGDDDAGGPEGYKQSITFTGNAVKAISLYVRQLSSTSSGIRLRDNGVGADRLLAALTWSADLPVLTMSVGTDLGYVALGSGVYRLMMATTSVTAANVNEFGIYPASVVPLAAGGTGNGDFGGVQAENATTPTSYLKTTTVAGSTLSGSFFSEIAGWSPVQMQGGHGVVIAFVLHES